jgi:hypothetical protein
MHMKTGILRLPILANAAFSFATGLFMALASPAVAKWLGPEAGRLYVSLGAGLLVLSIALGVIALRPTPLLVLAITAADLAWVICTTIALAVWNNDFTPLGSALVIGSNAIVSVIAWFQQHSIRRAFRVPGGQPGEFEVCIAADAPAEPSAFWSVLADLGAIRRYMPSLKSSALTLGDKPGPGCVRTCENVKGQVWSEQCDAWEEGKSFSVVFLAEQPGFPYPFSRMRGGWRVEPTDRGCQVQVWWRVVPRHSWAAAALLPLMAASARRGFVEVITRMALAANGIAPETVSPSRFHQLRAAAC